ncbi:hypothetical protein FOA52_006291 [Chlamydomonas sp. UWO 241]|nr:hypothetical protein FOA52_006291 [Chlamydomonas sp. UWO 241]
MERQASAPPPNQSRDASHDGSGSGGGDSSTEDGSQPSLPRGPAPAPAPAAPASPGPGAAAARAPPRSQSPHTPPTEPDSESDESSGSSSAQTEGQQAAPEPEASQQALEHALQKAADLAAQRAPGQSASPDGEGAAIVPPDPDQATQEAGATAGDAEEEPAQLPERYNELGGGTDGGGIAAEDSDAAAGGGGDGGGAWAFDSVADDTRSEVSSGGVVAPAAVRYRGNKAQLDMHMPQARLCLFLCDRHSGIPLPGAFARVTPLEHAHQATRDGGTHVHGHSVSAGPDGVARLALPAGVPHVVTAEASGFHKYGSMGEHLVVTLMPHETAKRAVGLISSSVQVQVTLRELRPLAGRGPRRDPHGQVNPMFAVPPHDPLTLVMPQKVAFYSPAGEKLSFVALPVAAHAALSVTATGAAADTVGAFSTDADGHCFFYAVPSVDGRASSPSRAQQQQPQARGSRAGGGAPPASRAADYSPQRSMPHVAASGSVLYAGDAMPQALPKSRGLQLGQAMDHGLQEDTPVWDLTGVDVEGGTGHHHGDPERVHNALAAGAYQLALADPSMMLVFYTHCRDDEQAEVEEAANALVAFEMPHGRPRDEPPTGGGAHVTQASSSTKSGRRGGSSLAVDLPKSGQGGRPARLPVQLYCRARPWFQILVYDIHTLEELGGSRGFRFAIHRLAALPDEAARASPEHARRHAEVRECLRSGKAAGDPTFGGAFGDLSDYLSASMGRGSLAVYWARAEVSALTQRRTLEASAPTLVEEGVDVEEEAAVEDLMEQADCVLVASGRLSQSMERQHWITPGERYAVEVMCEEPYLQLLGRQVRACSWQLEPFVFYTTGKVDLIVGAREAHSQQPVAGVAVTAVVERAVQPHRPPVVKQEWCEPTAAYADRIIDQLIDYVVQSKQARADSAGASAAEDVTGDDGLATLSVPPDCRLRLAIDARSAGDGRYEAGGTTGSSVDRGVAGVNGSVEGVDAGVGGSVAPGPGETAAARLAPTSAARQFYGFSLERVVDVDVSCIDYESGCGVGGAAVAAYDVTDHLARADDNAAAAAPAAAAAAGGLEWATAMPASGAWPSVEAGPTTAEDTSRATAPPLRRGTGPAAHARPAAWRTVPRRELGMSPGEQASDEPRQARALFNAVAHVSVEGLVPVHVCETGVDGRLQVPLTARAGTILKLVVTSAPHSHLLHTSSTAGRTSSTPTTSVLVYVHARGTVPASPTFRLLAKPRLWIGAADACTCEPVAGVRFRVFMRGGGEGVAAAAAGVAAAAAAADDAAAAAADGGGPAAPAAGGGAAASSAASAGGYGGSGGSGIGGNVVPGEGKGRGGDQAGGGGHTNDGFAGSSSGSRHQPLPPDMGDPPDEPRIDGTESIDAFRPRSDAGGGVGEVLADLKCDAVRPPQPTWPPGRTALVRARAAAGKGAHSNSDEKEETWHPRDELYFSRVTAASRARAAACKGVRVTACGAAREPPPDEGEDARAARACDAGTPAAALLARASSTARGTHRRLDLAAAAVLVDGHTALASSLLASHRARLSAGLAACLALEREYGEGLTDERRRGGLTGNSDAVQAAAAAAAKAVEAKAAAKAAAAAAGAGSPRRALLGWGDGGAGSKELRARMSAVPSRLLDLTASRLIYQNLVAASRGEAPATLIGDFITSSRMAGAPHRTSPRDFYDPVPSPRHHRSLVRLSSAVGGSGRSAASLPASGGRIPDPDTLQLPMLLPPTAVSARQFDVLREKA